MSIEVIRPIGISDPQKIQDIFCIQLGHQDTRGWCFDAGDPEIHKNKELLVVPGGKVLDLGMGCGRQSMFFALHGMSVVGYDCNPINVEVVNQIAQGYGLAMEARQEDILDVDFGTNEYDVILLTDVLYHFPNKKTAYRVIEKAIKALKPGGFLWLRTPGKEDDTYKQLVEYPESLNARHIDDDVFVAPCVCSGEYKDEYLLFFDQLELPMFMIDNGFKIMESRIGPRKGVKNRMYGEDWDWERTQYINGQVSFLAQKPTKQ